MKFINLDINTRAGVVNWRRIILAGCFGFWLAFWLALWAIGEMAVLIAILVLVAIDILLIMTNKKPSN